MRLYQTVAIHVIALGSATVLNANETYPTQWVDGWEIYGWEADCWMKTSFDDGTELLYSWDARNDDSYISIKNHDWRSIIQGSRYSLKIELDEWSFKNNASGHVKEGFPPSVSFFVDDKDNFMEKFMVAKSIRFRVDEKYIGGFKLKGSYNAGLALARCAYVLKNQRATDPFAK